MAASVLHKVTLYRSTCDGLVGYAQHRERGQTESILNSRINAHDEELTFYGDTIQLLQLMYYTM
jgi:hypothetical protein